jgi:hypothetical protein
VVQGRIIPPETVGFAITSAICLISTEAMAWIASGWSKPRAIKLRALCRTGVALPKAGL